MPSFTARFSIPFMNDRYDVRDVQKDIESDSVRLEIIQDSVLIRISRNEAVGVNEAMTVDPQSDSSDCFIDNDLNVNELTSGRIGITRILPASAGWHNQYVALPPFTFSDIPYYAVFEHFSMVIAVGGSVQVSLINQLPVELDSIRISVMDTVHGMGMHTFEIGHLNAGNGFGGDTWTLTVPTTFYNPVRIHLSGKSPGSATPVLIDTMQAVLSGTRADLKCAKINGKYQPQQIVSKDSSKSTTESVIHEARVGRGQVHVEFVNHDLQASSEVRLVLPDFKDVQGQPFIRSIQMPGVPGYIVNASYSLDGYYFNPAYRPPVGQQYFCYNYELYIPGATASDKTLENGQGVRARAHLDSLEMSSLSGIMAEETMDITERSQEIDIPYIDSVQFQSAFLEVIADHRIGFPAHFTLLLTGVSDNGFSRSLTLNGALKKYSGGGTGSRLDTITYDHSDSLAALLNILPDRIRVSGVARVGNGLDTGSIRSADSLFIAMHIRAPLIFRLPVDTTRNIIAPGPRRIELGEQTEDWIEHGFEQLNISGTLQNHFPVPITVQFFMDNHGYASDDAFYQNAGFKFPSEPIGIGAGIDQDHDGLVDQPSITTLNYLLEKSQYRNVLGNHDPKYNAVRIRLLGTPGYVTVRASDFIRLKTDLKIDFLVDEDTVK